MKLPNKEQYLKSILLENFKNKTNISFLDATCGNGYDTFFLATNFPQANIDAVDIQLQAIDNTKQYCNKLSNIKYFNESHLNFIKKINKDYDFIIFNTGYLPKSTSKIKTESIETIDTLKIAISKLKIGGFIAITLYQGHDKGHEHNEVLKYLKTINKYTHIVFTYKTINTTLSPNLYLIERKK